MVGGLLFLHRGKAALSPFSLEALPALPHIYPVKPGGNNEFAIPVLGPARIASPLKHARYVDEASGVLVDPTLAAYRSKEGEPAVLEQAGPRRKLFFEPDKVRAAIVTCGGLCPGLNDVIRAVTMVLWYRYGVREIMGLRYGYAGLTETNGHEPMKLDPETVEDIHKSGGTVLGSSRGPQDPAEMAGFIANRHIDILFTIGGDGTQRGAAAIRNEIAKLGFPAAVIGVPKTIDNDISYTERTFGFETATAVSEMPITSAHMEARGVFNGIGLVKLMGRESGFISAYATLATSDVNLLLIPEVPFAMERVLSFLEDRLKRKSHAVIVTAEGAGQDIIGAEGTDESGNRRLGDIGLYLKDSISRHFRPPRPRSVVKYIDPSYMIRSAPANADDSVFCFRLAENAVHAAMAGKTGLVVGLWNNRFVHVPMQKAVAKRKTVDPDGSLWQSILDNTGQPAILT
ncbi:MAG: ATP-dependent 6-phosphofructokinase [Kiritimatiellia bacterium]